MIHVHQPDTRKLRPRRQINWQLPVLQHKVILGLLLPSLRVVPRAKRISNRCIKSATTMRISTSAKLRTAQFAVPYENGMNVAVFVTTSSASGSEDFSDVEAPPPSWREAALTTSTCACA